MTSIHSGVQPGRMVAYGDDAWNICYYPGGVDEGPMIVVAGWGQGRVIAVGDHQMLNMDSYGADYSGQLYRNGLAWLAGTTSKSIRVVVAKHSSCENWLAEDGYTNVAKAGSYASLLANADVLVGWLGSSVSQSDLDAIEAFVKNGGGLFICEYGVGYDWWWKKPFSEAPGNRLLREVGIGFPGGHRWDSGTVDATDRATGQVTADDLLGMLADSSGYTSLQLEEGAYLMNGLFDVLPEGDVLMSQLDAAYRGRIDTINPTPSAPVKDSFDKALLKRESDILEDTPADQVVAHRTAEAVYGTIPADAERVTRTVRLDTSRGRWHGTGLYAAPGELVRVTVPPVMVDRGYRVRVNAHKDNISGRSSWERPPKVHRYFTIDATTVDVANAFGGSIFIDFRGGAYDAPPNLGQVDITISGAIEQPYFVLGEHTNEQWLNELGNRPAPYAVFACENLILSFRSAEASGLTRPHELMTWWNEVVRLEDELANRIEPRTGAELINVDVQNSAGAAHSGFPIQAYDKHWGNVADYERLTTRGSWGDFHELGHNHQRGWWTFRSDGEVTVNIFSTFVLRNMASGPSGGWSWVTRPADVMDRAIEAVAEAPTYSEISSVSDRLAFWVQLADGFGWDAYKQVFRGYELDDDIDDDRMPDGTAEEKDQWLVRFSQHVGYNLTRFMRDTWGLQVSQAAVDSVSHLPDWMPLATSIDEVTVLPGESHTFDIAASALSMDGVADIVGVGQPSQGTLENNGGGKWTYTAPAGYIGVDSFEFTLRSSAGNVQIFDVDISVTNRGVLMETWFGISGNYVSNLTSNSRYPDSPDETAVRESFDAPTDRGSDLGARMRAILIAPQTGQYTFWIASDDNSELWLSSGAEASDAVRIAYVSNWTDHNEWDKYPSQKSLPVGLQAGRRYYIEALMKEGRGDDNLSVAWDAGDTGPEVIGGEYLRVYGYDNISPAFSADPFDMTDAVEAWSYNGSLGAEAGDVDGDNLTFRKIDGPAWLEVSPSGGLSGVPADENVGTNSFTVRATDERGAFAKATMRINVLNTFAGEHGMSDLAGFSAQWQRRGCTDMPPCLGADLNGDLRVDIQDLAVLAERWLRN